MPVQDNPESSPIVAQLSAECRSLLDHMFDVNQETRISIPEIMNHPWFTRPLPQQYEGE